MSAGADDGSFGVVVMRPDLDEVDSEGFVVRPFDGEDVVSVEDIESREAESLGAGEKALSAGAVGAGKAFVCRHYIMAETGSSGNHCKSLGNKKRKST